MLTWYLSANFTVPAYGSSSSASFYDTANMWSGSKITLESPSQQTVLEVLSVVSTTSALLLNRYYSPNRLASAVFPTGSIATSMGFDSASITYGRFFPYQNIPYSTTFPAFNTRGGLALPVLDCAQSVTTDMLFSDIMPLNANLSLGLTTIIKWSAHVATTGSVKWNVAFQRLNGSIASASFDTLGTITSTTNGTIDTLTTSVIPALSTINGITPGDLYAVKVTRDGTNAADTMTTDIAEVACVEVRSAGT